VKASLQDQSATPTFLNEELFSRSQIIIALKFVVDAWMSEW
jgi:hypothetical protein